MWEKFSLDHWIKRIFKILSHGIEYVCYGCLWLSFILKLVEILISTIGKYTSLSYKRKKNTYENQQPFQAVILFLYILDSGRSSARIGVIRVLRTISSIKGKKHYHSIVFESRSIDVQLILIVEMAQFLGTYPSIQIRMLLWHLDLSLNLLNWPSPDSILPYYTKAEKIKECFVIKS